jgi:hypothetical protein
MRSRFLFWEEVLWHAYGLDRALVMFRFEKFFATRDSLLWLIRDTISIGADFGLDFAFGIGSDRNPCYTTDS